MNFFMNVVDERVKPDGALRKVDSLVDRQCLAAVPVPVRLHPGRAVAMSAR